MIYKKIIIALLFLNAVLVSAQDFNKTDANGKKDGVWKGVYEVSKRPRYEGTFESWKRNWYF
jgi:hypothetical protein